MSSKYTKVYASDFTEDDMFQIKTVSGKKKIVGKNKTEVKQHLDIDDLENGSNRDAVLKKGDNLGDYSDGLTMNGYNLTASKWYSFASGRSCSATADYARAHGFNCNAENQYAEATGNQATANHDGQKKFGVYSGSAYSQLGLFEYTFDATPTPLKVMGGYKRYMKPNANSLSSVEILVHGRSSDGTKYATYKLKGAVKMDADYSTLAILGQTKEVIAESDASLDAQIKVENTDSTYYGITAEVTGLASTTMKWLAHVIWIETT